MLTPRRTGPLAQLAVALAIASAGAALASACSNDSFSTAELPDGGEDSGGPKAPECPKAEPPAGSECLLPEGTTCDFGRCGTRIAQCSQGAWKFGANTAPSPACPMLPPTPDAPCPPCWPSKVCPYGSTDCSSADASPNTAVTMASCPSGRWVLDIRPCDGGGPDVQGDGGPDAD